jgi:hypothetical protein
VLSATSTNTANTIVKRDGSGNFAAGTITATAISSGTLTLTTPLAITSGGTGTNTATGTGLLVLSTSPALTGTPTAVTADVSSNSTQIATTAFVKASITSASVSDATATTKGILRLANDLGGTAELPTVNSVGGVSSSTITTVASSVNSATSVNTPNTIVKRDNNGGFSTGTITGTLSGTASNATALTTGRTIGITGDITYTSPAFDGTGNITATGTLTNTGVTANTYGTSTSVPTITVDSKGRITSASNTNIPSATSSVTGLLTSTDYAAFSGKQDALTLGTGVASFLASPTSTNLATAVTNDVGTGSLVFSSAPTLTNATLSGTLTLTSPLTVANGGTGTSTYTTGDILYASAANTLSKLPIGSTGQVLVTTIAGVPAWGSNGLFSLNGQSATTHSFATPSNTTTSTIDWTSSSLGVHTLNLPDATGTTRGLLSSASGTQEIGGSKTFKGGTIQVDNTLIVAGGWLSSKNFRFNPNYPNNSSATLGSILTLSDNTGAAAWSTNLNVGTITSTSLTTGALKVTGGTIANGSVLTSDAFGNATWGSNGLYTLNGQGATTHNFATSSTGNDFSISSNAASSTATHTFNLPDASISNRGVVTTGVQTFAGSKTFSGTTTVGTLKVTNGAPTTVGAVLTASATDGTVAWSTSNSASSLSGGEAGAIPYQTAPNTTGFTAAGTSGQILVSGGTGQPTWTSNISVGTITATGNFSGTSADFSKAVTGAPASGTSGTSIDFSQSNLAYTSASAGIFTLNGLRNGGTYTLAVQGGTSGTLDPRATGFGFVSLGNYPTVSGKHTVYTFVVMGTTVYYSMVSAQ